MMAATAVLPSRYIPLPGLASCTMPCSALPVDLTRAEVERAWPHWETRIGTDQRYYARRTCGAALTAGPGEDWEDLADQIRRKEAMLEESRPAAWRPL